ncbi:heterokaryon incompatibility protein-domain-containing protein [Truncatella angustata]|uniref:Heterokaryon incompatibility protein-domain-containing protein n=1 Tax=Truncatella angustata TaxID=152316 RepID=A0A9P8UDX3_9PEZI|nr:heterokaryon incompatibility protein-domain-containing protein [Truncatella angustata]KAH6648134.1 heterokaryon incompatibility protein-domain-containing protein [Truncatella angustata]
MRLLQLRNGDLRLTPDLIDDIPPYTILSHTWGPEERGANKIGYQKILFCSQQAKRDGLEYIWVDTCCIDKRSSAELTEAINSMLRLYQNGAHCYVYLSDVSKKSGQALRRWDAQFRQSRWFSRGWTLQEC